MSTLERAESWVDRFVRAFRKVDKIDAAVAETLAVGAPMLRLVLEAPQLLGHIHAYRSARELLVNSGSRIARAEYDLALKELATRMRAASRDARMAALIEIRAYHRFIGDTKSLEALAQGARLLPRSALEAVETNILRRAAEVYAIEEGPFAREALGFWTHFQRVVPPSDEAAWKEILEAVQKGPSRLRAGLADINNSAVAANSLEGHKSIVVGKLFESYASRSPQMASEFDAMLRLAAVRAKRLGEDWKELRVIGEMELVALDSKGIAAAVAKGGKLEGIGWQQFVDSSVVAAKLPIGGTASLGEIDFVALFQFKAEAGPTALTEQLTKDLSRLFGGSTNKTILARFHAADASGQLTQYVARVRPPDLRQELTAYAAATSNTAIPNDALLSQLNVTLKRVNLPRSRDEFFELADILIAAAVE